MLRAASGPWLRSARVGQRAQHTLGRLPGDQLAQFPHPLMCDPVGTTSWTSPIRGASAAPNSSAVTRKRIVLPRRAGRPHTSGWFSRASPWAGGRFGGRPLALAARQLLRYQVIGEEQPDQRAVGAGDHHTGHLGMVHPVRQVRGLLARPHCAPAGPRQRSTLGPRRGGL
jgi:hypothetical protein